LGAFINSRAISQTHEAHELRDGDNRYMGKGVIKAVGHIEENIAPDLKQTDRKEQEQYSLQYDQQP
jgi:enolase